MMLLQVAVLALAAAVFGQNPTQEQTSLASLPAGNGPEAVTPAGVIRGSWMKSRRGRDFEAYRGIRYAEPPVGDLRFQPAKPIYKYKGVLDASQEGPACPLIAPDNYDTDEDCLRINVYTPNSKSAKPLPVILFIHAGGFFSMTGRSDVAGPDYLLDKDVVFVTINYRLSMLGFLSTGDKLAPGNNGFKDQVVALKWIQRNIAAFGGDPGCVTITGCSAGSISVMLHMISPMSKGLFHRGISMSGAATQKVYNPKDLRGLGERQAQLVNCTTENSKAMIDCLKTKTWRELTYTFVPFYNSQDFGRDPAGFILPVVEKDLGQEVFLPIQPIDAIRQGKMHAVPWIVAQTRDEFFWIADIILKNETLRTLVDQEWDRIAPTSLWLLRGAQEAGALARRVRQHYLGGGALRYDAATFKKLGTLYADAITGFSIHRNANLMCRHSPKPVYYYVFDYIGNNSHYADQITGKPLGVAHHDDMIYLFRMSYAFPLINTTSSDGHMVDKMTAIWYNFARYGDPNPRGCDQSELSSLSWPPMKPNDRKFLRIGKEFSVERNLFEDRYQFWEDNYRIQY